MKESKEIMKQKPLIKEAFHLAKGPTLIALVLTPLRYSLELIGIPEKFIFLIGLLWLTIGVSIYWAIKFHDKDRFLILLLLGLVIYSPISRVPVAVAWWVDTNWKLGTHYGLYFDTIEQVFLNQVAYGSIVQIIPGFIIGSVTFAIMQQRQTMKLKNNTLNNG